MKFIIKPFAEIMVKSKPVKKKFLAVLQTNIANSLKRTNIKYKVSSFWDFLEVNIFSESFNVNEIKKILGRIP
jgi:thiamine biosynthesis protein ThiI